MTQCALIVAHGSPADPLPLDQAMQCLAQQVARHLPGWRVLGATLAAEGSLERALAALERPLIYPFFMAEGFFTRTTLPKRLAAAGHGDLIRLAAFGHDPALPDLLAQVAAEATENPAQSTLVLAAHGSQVSRASANITEAIAARLRQSAGFRQVLTGYVEEEPFLKDVARLTGPAVCLPCFATRAGHVLDDIPEALAEAGFPGSALPPIGEHPKVPEMIALSLLNAHAPA